MLFKLSNLNSNLALTLGYLNPALNNSALVCWCAGFVDKWGNLSFEGLNHGNAFIVFGWLVVGRMQYWCSWLCVHLLQERVQTCRAFTGIGGWFLDRLGCVWGQWLGLFRLWTLGSVYCLCRLVIKFSKHCFEIMACFVWQGKGNMLTYWLVDHTHRRRTRHHRSPKKSARRSTMMNLFPCLNNEESCITRSSSLRRSLKSASSSPALPKAVVVVTDNAGMENNRKKKSNDHSITSVWLHHLFLQNCQVCWAGGYFLTCPTRFGTRSK